MKLTFIFFVAFCLTLTARDFIKEGGGLEMPVFWWLKKEAIFIQPPKTIATPPRFDIRELIPNGMLPVKNQRCGDCWAQASTAAAEIRYQLMNPDEPHQTYSVQELISNCPNTGGSCQGGYFKALGYVTGVSGPGVPLEEDLPYKGYNTRCIHSVEKAPRGTNWAYIGRRGPRGATIEEMKVAMLKYGPLVVDVRAFGHQGPSVYTACRYGTTNHMVTLIGWQDDDSIQGGGYWLMRNSWGNSFGVNGIGKVAYKDRLGRKCAGTGNVTAAIVEPALDMHNW